MYALESKFWNHSWNTIQMTLYCIFTRSKCRFHLTFEGLHPMYEYEVKMIGCYWNKEPSTVCKGNLNLMLNLVTCPSWKLPHIHSFSNNTQNPTWRRLYNVMYSRHTHFRWLKQFHIVCSISVILECFFHMSGSWHHIA